MAVWKVSDDELFKEIENAKKATALNFNNEPKIESVNYIQNSNLLSITLLNEVVLNIPIHLISELANATKEQISKVSLTPLKETLVWEDLDIHISLKGLIIDSLKLLDWMGGVIARKNGQVKSELKAETSKINGKKGGRPPLNKETTEKKKTSKVIALRSKNIISTSKQSKRTKKLST